MDNIAENKSEQNALLILRSFESNSITIEQAAMALIGVLRQASQSVKGTA